MLALEAEHDQALRELAGVHVLGDPKLEGHAADRIVELTGEEETTEAASALNEKLPKLKEVIDAGQQPCSAICAQALLQCHRLLDDAEAKTDEGIAKQNAAAAEARATFEAKAAQTARVEALEGAE